jgi:hypothetical protein
MKYLILALLKMCSEFVVQKMFLFVCWAVVPDCCNVVISTLVKRFNRRSMSTVTGLKDFSNLGGPKFWEKFCHM